MLSTVSEPATAVAAGVSAAMPARAWSATSPITATMIEGSAITSAASPGR